MVLKCSNRFIWIIFKKLMFLLNGFIEFVKQALWYCYIGLFIYLCWPVFSKIFWLDSYHLFVFLSRSSSLLIHVIFLHISTCFDSFAKSSRAYQLLSADSSEVHGKNEHGSFLHLKNHTQHTLIYVVLYSRVTTDNWNWRELQHLCDKPGHGVTNHQGYYGSAYWWHIPGMLGTLS